MPSPQLVDKLYAELIIGCEAEGCHEVFLPTEMASDPVEPWSVRAAAEAESLGWSLSPMAMVLCPKCSRSATP
jgi:hypothetical protein